MGVNARLYFKLRRWDRDRYPLFFPGAATGPRENGRKTSLRRDAGRETSLRPLRAPVRPHGKTSFSEGVRRKKTLSDVELRLLCGKPPPFPRARFLPRPSRRSRRSLRPVPVSVALSFPRPVRAPLVN